MNHTFEWRWESGDPPGGGGCSLLTPDSLKKNYEAEFCLKVLIEIRGRRLHQKSNNDSKMVASVTLMYSYGRI